MLINEKLDQFFDEVRPHIEEDTENRFLLAISGDQKQAPNGAKLVVYGESGNIVKALYEISKQNSSLAVVILRVAQKLQDHD